MEDIMAREQHWNGNTNDTHASRKQMTCRTEHQDIFTSSNLTQRAIMLRVIPVVYRKSIISTKLT